MTLGQRSRSPRRSRSPNEKSTLSYRVMLYLIFFSYWQAEQILYRNICSKMNILPIKWVFRSVNGVSQAITWKNQICTTGSCDTSFFSYWQAEQISYRNIWSKMNILPIKGVFRTVNGVNHAITWKNQICTIGSCDTLFFSYLQAEQILYRNIWSEINILAGI